MGQPCRIEARSDTARRTTGMTACLQHLRVGEANSGTASTEPNLVRDAPVADPLAGDVEPGLSGVIVEGVLPLATQTL